jgi:hypothetical protein
VEAQHQIATRKLVETDAEQHLLEELIDAVKPPAPAGASQHYLIFTPFRYPPLRHGSRFGTRSERGVWYGSLTRSTALAEVAYYRLLFLDGTTARLDPLEVDLTAFRAALRTPRGVDLTGAQFARYVEEISSPSSYAASQQLGRDMRGAGVEACRYHSARDPGGVNVAAFTPAVFGRRQPRSIETWRCTAVAQRVEFTRRDYFTRASYAFARERFLVAGKLPAPAL